MPKPTDDPLIPPAVRIVLGLVFSLGWILPALVAMDLLRKAQRQAMGVDPIASFPFEHYARRMTAIVVWWLAAVVLFWAGVLLRSCWRRFRIV